MKTFRDMHALLTPAERRSGIALLALMIVGMILETLGIGAVFPTIALLMQPDVASKYPALTPALALLGNPTGARLITIGMLALVALFFVKTVFLAFLLWRQTKFSFDVQAHLSQRLFTTYLRQPYTFHLQRNSAQLIRNAITEVNQFTFNVLLPSLLLLTEGFVIAGIATLLLFVEPVGAILVVVVLGAASWFFYRGTRGRIGRWGVARQHHEGLRIQHLQQGLGGAKDVKLLGREREFLSQYAAHNVEAARVGHMQATLAQLPRLWLELLGVAGLATLVLTMLAQKRGMDAIVPALGMFAIAAFRLMPSVNRVLGAVQQLRYGAPVVELLHREAALAAPAPFVQRAAAAPLQKSIDVVRVSYSYPESAAKALDAVSITVGRGESVGVIGPSGSGKSTLVDVMLGLLTPISGTVRVDGRDTAEHMRSWQDQVGYVAQTVYLTDDTLRRNVAFGLRDDEIDDVAVRRALRAAQMEEFVASLPEGLNAFVGERGVRLSGGQRQRIGIARALYHDPDVLVLDEATSALDTVTEMGVMQAVAALHGDKTILIVAHRVTTVAQCDRIYRLERGKVVAEGLPTQVLHVERVV